MNVIPYVTACAATWLCVTQAVAAPATITLEPGQQKTWTQVNVVKRAATGNPDVVGVNVVPPRGVIITANAPGTAMVSVWEQDRDTPASQFQIVVTPASLHALKTISGEGSSTQVTPEGTKLRVTGTLSSLEGHDAIDTALSPNSKIIDTTATNFDVQVRMDIKIVEVSRSKLKEAGFFYHRLDYRPDGSSAGSTGLSGPNIYGGFTKKAGEPYEFLSNSGFVPFSNAFNIFSVSDNVWATFSALESNGFAYALAEPSLTALSGQTATFLAGGEIPIPFRSGMDGSITVKFKEFGIRLSLSPTVLDQHRIALKVSPEVSEIDPNLSVSSGGYTIPGLRVRRTDTTVAIGDGETFVISGLVSHQNNATIDKFPFLGDIPILGAFFRSNHFERDDKELLMIATPHLVRPFAKNAKLPALPGADISNYDPGFMHLFLKETGRFDPPDSGFSN
jgi:pilus assembly protein CpaC